MSEQYLEWLFLREILDLTVNDSGDDTQLSFNGNLYGLDKIRMRCTELTEQLLKGYKL